MNSNFLPYEPAFLPTVDKDLPSACMRIVGSNRAQTLDFKTFNMQSANNYVKPVRLVRSFLLQVTTAITVRIGWTLVHPDHVTSGLRALPMGTASPATALKVAWIQIILNNND